jgi:hypothetical protein
MAKRRIRVDHTLLKRLRELDKEAALRFHDGVFPGFGSLGLILDKKLDDSRYDCTPLNCQTFAHTGGEGVHFSFLVQDGFVRETSPIVVTVPQMPFQSFVVGENLFDFLCLGADRGFFALEQLAYNPALTLEVFTNSQWEPTDSSHWHVGYGLSEENKLLLEFLRNELRLQSWPSASRFQVLQEQYAGLLEQPDEE